MSDFNYLEDAKILVPIDSLREEYYTFLFIGLIIVGCKLNKAIRLINSELKNTENKINYNHLYYKEGETIMIMIQQSGSISSNILPKESWKKISKIDEGLKLPESNLGNMIWIYTMLTTKQKTLTDFIYELKQNILKVVNIYGG